MNNVLEKALQDWFFFCKKYNETVKTIILPKIAHDQTCRMIWMPEEVKETESLQLEEEITYI